VEPEGPSELEKTSEGGQAGQNGIAQNKISPPKINGDKYWMPFKLAIKTQNSKLIETALDSLQKLMAFHLMRGASTIYRGDTQIKLIDEMIEVICSCFVGAKTEESIQLQIIKALLTAITSPLCEIHGDTLIKAIQTCFSIFLLSKNIVNQITAKASLTQIVNLIFQRMEKHAASHSKDLSEKYFFFFFLQLIQFIQSINY